MQSEPGIGLTNACIPRVIRTLSCGQVAQSVEQGTENPRVGSSILSLATFPIGWHMLIWCRSGQAAVLTKQMETAQSVFLQGCRVKSAGYGYVAQSVRAQHS